MELAIFVIKIGVTVWAGKYIMDRVLSVASTDSDTSKAKKLLQDRLKHKNLASLELSTHEAAFVEGRQLRLSRHRLDHHLTMWCRYR